MAAGLPARFLDYLPGIQYVFQLRWGSICTPSNTASVTYSSISVPKVKDNEASSRSHLPVPNVMHLVLRAIFKTLLCRWLCYHHTFQLCYVLLGEVQLTAQIKEAFE